jgi:hypothetical protein
MAVNQACRGCQKPREWSFSNTFDPHRAFDGSEASIPVRENRFWKRFKTHRLTRRNRSIKRAPPCACVITAMPRKKNYVHWITKYIFYNGLRHSDEMDEKEITNFLSRLTMKENIFIWRD